MSSINNYDFDSDPEWRIYRANISIPSHLNEADVIKKYKAKYYKNKVDPDFDIDAYLKSSFSAGTSTSANFSSSGSGTASSSSSSNYNNRYSSSASSGTSTSSGNHRPQSPPHAQTQQTGTRVQRLKQAIMTIEGAFFILNSLIFVSSVIALLPLQVSYACYRQALLLSMVTYAMSLYRAHGKNWQRMAADENAHYLMLALLLFMSVQFSMFIIPFLIVSLFNATFKLQYLLRTYDPDLLRVLEPYLNKITERANQALYFVAFQEFLTGVFLIINILLPTRNLLLTLFYWNFISMRYRCSRWTQLVFQLVGQRLDAWTANPACPALVRNIYHTIKTHMRNYVRTR